MRQFVCDQTQLQRISIQCICHKQLILHKTETFSVLLSSMHLKPLLRYRTFGRSYRHFAVAAVEAIFPVVCGSMAVFVGRASKPRWARAVKLRGDWLRRSFASFVCTFAASPLRSALGKTAMLRRLPFPYYGSIPVLD